MHVVGINGSARKDGNTAIMIKEVFKVLESQGITTELIQLAGKKMHGCIACGKCGENKNRLCAVTGDFMNDCIAAMDKADGVILGSPTYFANVSTGAQGPHRPLGHGRPAQRFHVRPQGGRGRGGRTPGRGPVHVFNSINHLFFINQMVVPGSCYWNLGLGREKGEVTGDEEGLRTMRRAGREHGLAAEEDPRLAGR